MEYLTRKFANTHQGLRLKDDATKLLTAEGYRITSEQIEQGHIKGNEQCCWAVVCLPGIFLAGRTPALIVVTYGREDPKIPQVLAGVSCRVCKGEVHAGATFCVSCGANLKVNEPVNSMRKCPFCAEQIQAEAKKCRFCSEFLNGGSQGGKSAE